MPGSHTGYCPVLVDKAAAVADIEEIIVKNAGKYLDTVKLFDVYTGERIAADKKSVAYAISFPGA